MKKSISTIAILVTLLIAFAMGFMSINVLGEYGWTVFVIIPILIGFLPPFIVGRLATIKKNEAYRLSFISLLLSIFAMLVFAIEGLICIFMASPILFVFVWLGSYLGFKINNMNNPTNITIIILLISVGSMSFDCANEPSLIPVKTKIIVNSSIENVWKNVVTFDKLEEPKDWIFKTGISYPVNATIEGTGVGAIRYCNFTTGSFIEPITTWNEPNLLQFSVVEQPIPMTEFNPFWDIHPAHLDGYFKSYKGQFKLTKINESQTELEGTTWYKVDITPQLYWKMWSDFIIHRIHKRVLNHIKKESEE